MATETKQLMLAGLHIYATTLVSDLQLANAPRGKPPLPSEIPSKENIENIPAHYHFTFPI